MRESPRGDDVDLPSTSAPPPRSSHPLPNTTDSVQRLPCCSHCNVFYLLKKREVCPVTKHSSKRLWRGRSKPHPHSFGSMFEASQDARRGLLSWVEAESFKHLSAKYCPLFPPPRSTIAAAFSPDRRTLASTHGDHTVKIIDCQTGNCLKVLRGHYRTPWVVRFHPFHPEILASGSLDQEVRLWDANTAECIGSQDFYRPVASIAFHAQGGLLAVASGHKLYMWYYNSRGEESSPTVVLKTRRSLRAVHFHPHAAPLLLTAEVNDLDSSDSSITVATCLDNPCSRPPTVYVADPQFTCHPSLPNAGNVHFNAPSTKQQRADPSKSVKLLTYNSPSGQYELLLSPIAPSSLSPPREETENDSSMVQLDSVPLSDVHVTENADLQLEGRSNNFFPFGDPAYWELPFLQGWLVGQSLAGHHTSGGPGHEVVSAFSEMENTGMSRIGGTAIRQSRIFRRSSIQNHSSHSSLVPAAAFGESATLDDVPCSESDTQLAFSRMLSEISTSIAAAAELPCTVKLRLWHHDIKNPCAPLDPARCRLTIPHAVLCSEMGAHFSPSGRFLAACVACVLPQFEADSQMQSQLHHDFTGVATSPTQHPVPAQQVLYELRIYSLEEPTFGSVLASCAIRAAHCLTSIQFSPTSEHLLLGYGRRHNSLLKSVIIDGETTIPIYTILEIYRVSDMELVRVLLSAEDEVNVACFHPSVGGGLVYGTKEGRLRILQYDVFLSMNYTASNFFNENMHEVQTYAIEG